MKKSIVKSGCFIIVFILLFCFFSNIMQPEFYCNGNEVDKAGYEDKYYAFYEERKNSLDILFLGPSTSYYSFLPIELYKKHGITSFVLSSGAQTMSTSFYELESALQYQIPQYVILDCSMLVKNYQIGLNIAEKNNNYKAIQEISNPILKYKALISTKPYDYEWDEWLVPMTKFHTRWKEINGDDFRKNKQVEKYPSYYKGSFINTSVSPYYQKRIASIPIDASYSESYITMFGNFNDKEEFSRLQIFYGDELDREQQEYFQKIKQLCEKENVELICIKGPSAVAWSEQKHYTVKSYLEEQGLEFLDFNYGKHKVEIDWQTETADNGYHVNYYGALKATNYLGEYLTQNYQFVNHREDDNYADWEIALVEYNNRVWQMQATANEKSLKWLEHLNEIKDGKVIFIAVRDDISFGFNDDFQEQIGNLGIQTDLHNNHKNSFMAIIDDSKVIYEKKGNAILLYKDVIKDDKGTTHKVELKSAGMAQGDSCYIKIDDVNYEVGGQGFNIVVYDKVDNCVTESVSIHLYKDGIFKKR